MPPVPAGEEWLPAHLVTLVQALGHYSFHHKRNPLQVLLDAANTALLQVLAALETVTQAGYYARRFTKGLPDWAALEDPDVLHCFTFFTRQLQRYQKMYVSFTVDQDEDVLPHTWVQQQGSLYLTFSPAQLPELSGLAAALVDGLLRYHQTFGRYENLLLVMDAAFAKRLPAIEQLLKDATAYGVTVILTADSLLTLHSLAADGDGAACWPGASPTKCGIQRMTGRQPPTWPGCLARNSGKAIGPQGRYWPQKHSWAGPESGCWYIPAGSDHTAFWPSR